MTDYRYGDIVHPSGGYRYGDIAHASLTARSVGTGSGIPGSTAVVALGGTWDAANKTATLNGVALTLSDQDATSVTFTVPTPYADGSAHAISNLDVAYDLVVDDSGAAVAAGSFTIAAPDTDGPTYWYIPAVSGSAWDESSLWDGSTLVAGNSAIVEMIAGTLSSLSTIGNWTAADPFKLQAKGWNSEGWSTSWATFIYRDSSLPIAASASVAADGDSTTVVFDEPVLVAGTPTVLITATNGQVVGTYASGSESDSLVFSNARTIDPPESVSVAYSQNGTITDVAGDAVASFSISASNNSSGSIAPTVLSARISSDGSSIVLSYSEGVTADIAERTATGYALTASGGALTMTYASGSGTSKAVYTLSRVPAKTETITLAYVSVLSSDAIQNSAGDDLANFSGKVVGFFTSDAVSVGPSSKPVIRNTVKSVAL